MKTIHMVTYSRVQSDAQVGGSQASPRWNNFENAWKVKRGTNLIHQVFTSRFPPRNLDEALIIGDCHVTCLMRCLVIDVISLGSV